MDFGAEHESLRGGYLGEHESHESHEFLCGVFLLIAFELRESLRSVAPF